MINITKNELDEMESELYAKLSFCRSVQGNPKEIEKQLEIIKLAKIGYMQMVD